MITRIWRGWTTPENADACLLRRDLGGEVEFATIMLFDSFEQVRGFAGEGYEGAYVPPRARAVLARFDQRSAHPDTLLRPHIV